MQSSIEYIARAIDFIEDHLQHDISVADMADSVGYSIYHFCRTFNKITHHTPYDYLMRRRLSESARALLESERKIIEVGIDYQFNSPEVYSRAFKRLFDLPPTLWREKTPAYPPRIMPRLTISYLEHINKGDYLRPQDTHIDALNLAGVMTPVHEDPQVIPDLWRALFRLRCTTEDVKKTEPCFGISLYPEAQNGDLYFYMAAIEADDKTGRETELVQKRLTASRYVRFVHMGKFQEIHHSRNYIFHTWMPKSGLQLAHRYEISKFYCQTIIEDSDTNEIELFIPVA